MHRHPLSGHPLSGHPLSRRHLLRLAAAAPAGVLLPRPARAADTGNRKFLFIFCEGGWDQTYAFAPLFGSENVDMPTDAEPGTIAGIPLVLSEERPSLTSFFEAHGARTAVINGVEIRAVAHDVCYRLAMTGNSVQGQDDWAATLAGASAGDWMMPQLHMSGPSYTDRYGSAVVRLGSNGQLSELIDGSAMALLDPPLTLPSEAIATLEDQLVTDRLSRFQAAAGGGFHAELADLAQTSEDRMLRLQELADEFDIEGGDTLVDRARMLLQLLSRDFARVGMVAYRSWMGVFNGWDTHTDNPIQSFHFEELFSALDALMDEAAATPGIAAASFADELTIVVLSEMGRYPLLNRDGGKDHWTYTSAMLIGGGIRGGQAVGGYDEYSIGQPIDLGTGAVDPKGKTLLPSHLGATLLALGGLDPGEHIEEAEPIAAVIAD